MCVTFVILTDCDTCARPISTKPGSIEADEHGLTRGTWFFPHRLEVVAVAGRMWVRGVYSVGRDCFVLSMNLHFQIRRPRTVSVESMKGLRPPANLSTTGVPFSLLAPEKYGVSS